MTASAPWSVKGIDPKAREAAKDLARRSGLTLGEWLNQRIREEGDSIMEDANSVTDALEELTDRIEATEQRSTLAVTGIDQSVRGMLARLELSEREQTAVGARFEGALQETSQMQAMLDARLRKLEDEAVGPRSAEALKSLEAALGRVANHLYDGESRTRESLADVRRDMGNLTVRLENAEKAAGDKGEDVAGRLIERLDQAQARTEASVRALQDSFIQIERRLAAAESKVETAGPASADVDRKLEAMAADLARGLQAAKVEMTKQLREAIDGGADRMDQALLDMTAHVQAAERRSAEALERMGQEVLRVADTLSRRVQGVETRAAGAIQQVGGEVARVVDTLDARVSRSDTLQSQALEKLGSEVERVTERLTDRIGIAERRSAQAVDDVGEQVSRISERLSQRYDRSASDLAERIRQSEERTARLLEDARERFDRKVAEAARKAPEPAPVAAFEPAPVAPFAEPQSFADPFAAPSYIQPQAEAAAAPPTLYPDAAPFGQVFAPTGFTLVEPEFDAQDIDAAQDFATPLEPQSEADFAEEAFISADHTLDLGDEDQDEDDDRDDDIDGNAAAFFAVEPDDELVLAPTTYRDAPPPQAAPTGEEPRMLSTRELIDQARAAARAASPEHDKIRKLKTKANKKASITHPALDRDGFGNRRKQPAGGRVALFATLTGATLMLGTAGYMLFNGPYSDQVPGLGKGPDKSRNSTDALEAGDVPRAAVALDPKPIDGASASTGANVVPATAAVPADGPNAGALYVDGRARIENKDNTGLESLRRAANLGHPQAQFYLGRLYEDGAAGLTKNLTEARRWYERAAGAGDRGAMHNVGLMYFEGIGGPKNLTTASQWFRRAAELGLVDSQYNLGQLYEQGLGVTQNSAESYKWYLLASRSGTVDQRSQARTAANRVKITLPTDARLTAERIASDVAQRNSGAPIQVAAAHGVDLPSAQRALARLGYYKGSADGASTGELRVAIQAYQRDQGLSPNGELDTATVMRMAPHLR